MDSPNTRQADATGNGDAPDKPTDIRPRRWGQVLKRTVKEFQQDNLTDWAAALTYYGVLAMFPALIALVSIVGLFADPQATTRTLTEVINNLSPGTAADTLRGPIESVTSNRSASGVGLVIGLAA